LKGFSKQMIPFHGSYFKYKIVPCWNFHHVYNIQIGIKDFFFWVYGWKHICLYDNTKGQYWNIKIHVNTWLYSIEIQRNLLIISIWVISKDWKYQWKISKIHSKAL
jgi:hypothetical protein